MRPSDTDRQALNTTAHPARYHVFSKDGWHNIFRPVLCLVTQPCPTLCNPWTGSPSGSSVHGDAPGKNTGVDCHALLQGIFPTQRSNPGLPHCRWILYIWATRISPKNIGVGSISLLQRILLTQESNQGPSTYRQILYQLSCSFYIVTLSLFSSSNREYVTSPKSRWLSVSASTHKIWPEWHYASLRVQSFKNWQSPCPASWNAHF